MPITIIRDETSIDELVERLAGPRAATPELRRRAGEALKLANRHVDFTRLRPGVVLDLPDDLGLPARGPGEPAATGVSPVDQIERDLRAAKSRMDKGLRAEDLEDAEAQKLLQSREVQELANRDAGAKALLAEAAKALAARAKERAQRQNDLDELFNRAEEDFRRVATRTGL